MVSRSWIGQGSRAENELRGEDRKVVRLKKRTRTGVDGSKELDRTR